MPAFPEKDWDDSPLVAVLPKYVHQLSFDPGRFHRIWSEDNQEPIAAIQRASDFIVPLRGAGYVGFAEPITNSVLLEDFQEPLDETSIPAGMRNEDFDASL